jgi:hypothetical protein
MFVGNFGPRQPAYWLGTGDHINMPEDTSQSPSYSILYGKLHNVPLSVAFVATLAHFA